MHWPKCIFMRLCIRHRHCLQRHYVFRLSVHRVRPFVCPDRYCYHDISWTAWAVSMELNVLPAFFVCNLNCTIWMFTSSYWLDSGCQRSRSQQAVVKASTSTLGGRVPSSSLFFGRLFDRIDLKTRSQLSVRPCVRTCVYVRTSVSLSTKTFANFSEIWHVCRQYLNLVRPDFWHSA